MDKHEGMHRDEIKPVPAPDQELQDKPGAKPLREGPPLRIPTPEADDDKAEVPITSREWWIQNAPSIGIVVAILVFFFGYLGVQPVIVAKVAIGLSLVIFLHELGHFLAAKWCDVHVTTFSIGFGPSVPGCNFKWGETTYKLGLVPLGGYVQMVGQVDGDEASDGSEDDPRSYRNKSVGQRMMIISAGVIMNVILAIICFVVVFRGPGKDRLAPVIGGVDSGTPAFAKGLRTGAAIEQIGDIKNPTFDKLMVRVMIATRGEKLEFVSKLPGDPEPKVLWIEPRNDSDKGDKKAVIGIAFPLSTQLLPSRYVSSEFKMPAEPDSPAARATPPFEFGDKIVATTDPDDPTKLLDLPDDPRFEKHGRRDFFKLLERFQLLAGKSMIVQVEREDGKKVDITLPPTFYQTLGVRMQMGEITNVREDSPAASAGVVFKSRLRGDLIQKVEITEPGGSVTTIDEKNLDPERLPFQLRQWAERMVKARVPEKDWKKVVLSVRREKGIGELAQQFESKTLKLTWDNDWRFDRALSMGPTSPQAIPELGLAYQIKTIVADVAPDLMRDNPLQPGDAVREIQIFQKDPRTGQVKPTLKSVLKEEDQWASVAYLLQLIPSINKAVLKVYRNQKTEDITVYPVHDETWPVPDRGLVFLQDFRRQKASGTLEAIGLGFSDTWDNMKQVFQNLRGMIMGTISPENLGGPVTIARVAYKIAGMDFWEFVFFLGLISVNLAVINFLPIPVLDGGHMVFLVYEKLRGKPASEGVRIGATYAGLALILCLMVFVLWLDFSRL